MLKEYYLLPLIDRLTKLRNNFRSEEEEFAQKIKTWLPLSLIIGFLVGLAMTFFALFIYGISLLLGGLTPFLALIIGGLVVWLLIKFGFEDAENNGISYVIRQRHKREGIPLNQTHEFISAGVALGAGLPVGREGPALIIGSAIATALGKWRKIPKQDLHEAITIGSAAATGALFQAPFGSAVFAAEVPYKEDSDEPMLMNAILASVVAAITLRTIISYLANHGIRVDLHLFRLGSALLEVTVYHSFLAALLGLIIGFLGRFVIEIYYRYQRFMRNRFIDTHRIAIGLTISLLSLLVGILTIDNFYLDEGINTFDDLRIFIDPSIPNIVIILLGLLIIQIIATVAIIAVGFPGGIFSPSLAIGAISGIIFGIFTGFTSNEHLVAFAIVGMSASHAAFTKTPVASILLVLEVTNLPNLIIPIILANISAYIISGSRSLYEGQIRSRDATLLKELTQYDQFEELLVDQIMTPREKVITSSSKMGTEEMRVIAMKRAKRTFPVIDEQNKVIGIVTFSDITNGLSKGKEFIHEVMTTQVVSIPIGVTLRDALVVILNGNVERAPVVNTDNELMGIVSMSDVLLGHQKLMDQFRDLARNLH